MMADRHDIDEVRTRVDIVSVVEQYVTLKRSGNRLKGLCPFHQEKTPSFHVNPDLGMWHCFGQCAEGGDVFKFIQKIENLSFPEALERLALRAGVTLAPKTARTASSDGAGAAASSEAGERDRLYRINALALNFYRDMLARSSEAREYLQGRDIAHAIQEAFHIGYAPDMWDGLTTFLTRKGVPLADAEKAGLVSKNDRGGYYDKLRGRLIFPILDVQERPIAFGGRLIADARPGQPKYWNSPETPVFSKSRTLYGLWRARKAIAAQGQAVVVEGYTDVVAAHQAGFENVVATLGTSLTEEHVRVLARLAPTVLLGFDADSAGLKAAFRAGEIFEAQEVEVRVLDLPDGDDPDSLLRAGKRRVFEQAMANALPLVEYRLKRLVQKEPTETERDRVALFRKALPILASVPSMIEREQYVKLLAPYHPQYQTGAVYAEEQIRQDVAAQASGAGRAPETRFQPTPPRAPAAVVRPGSATDQAEHHLLRALTGDDPALAELVLAQIEPAEFLNASARALASAVYAHYASAPSLDPGLLLARLDDETLRGALSALMMEQGQEPLTPALIDGEIAHLKQRAKQERRTALGLLIKQGQASPEDQEEFRRLLTELKGTRSPHPVGVN